ncbi:uncharacterized protein LOC118348600 [Juglans regia]|uniref:Uncharacterized protein LOC118348600 n=1 Tax=Juglans regia TaxID=51240 RepID=A0A6P9EE58_JUGRE|nr:uncharacterized protein LOC118348600 [Juglans regia]
MAKAYDSVDWNFFIHVMEAAGFSSLVCNLVRRCISSPWFSVVMNGVPISGRGLQPGDLISPYLFIMVEEILSRLLKKKFHEGKIVVFSQPKDSSLVSHLLYADDIVISNGNKASLRSISQTPELYESWSGQRVSKEKSSIIFSKHIPISRRRSVLRLTGFTEGTLPFKYLGVPMVPKSIICSINKSMSNFFWGYKDGRPKKYWRSRDSTCKPVQEGGIGLRNLMVVEKALHMKLAWKLLTKQSLWSNFFKAKYVRKNRISLIDGSKVSSFWKSILKCLLGIVNNSKWKSFNNALCVDDRIRRTAPIGHGSRTAAEFFGSSSWSEVGPSAGFIKSGTGNGFKYGCKMDQKRLLP